MKTYLFNVENGLYEGEAFEDADAVQYDDGVTTVEPPDYVHGEIPIFDTKKNEWAIIPVNIARQLLNTNEKSEP